MTLLRDSFAAIGTAKNSIKAGLKAINDAISLLTPLALGVFTGHGVFLLYASIISNSLHLLYLSLLTGSATAMLTYNYSYRRYIRKRRPQWVKEVNFNEALKSNLERLYGCRKCESYFNTENQYLQHCKEEHGLQ